MIREVTEIMLSYCRPIFTNSRGKGTLKELVEYYHKYYQDCMISITHDGINSGWMIHFKYLLQTDKGRKEVTHNSYSFPIREIDEIITSF